MHLTRSQQALLRQQIKGQRDRILSDTKSKPDRYKPITMGEVMQTFDLRTYKQEKFE
jgi:hypothetical protein